MGNNETVDKTEWNAFPFSNPEQVIFFPSWNACDIKCLVMIGLSSYKQKPWKPAETSWNSVTAIMDKNKWPKSVNNQSFKLMLDLKQLPQEQAFSHKNLSFNTYVNWLWTALSTATLPVSIPKTWDVRTGGEGVKSMSGYLHYWFDAISLWPRNQGIWPPPITRACRNLIKKQDSFLF